MLKMSKLADYGALVMTYLATTSELQNANEIANETSVGAPTVAKLLKTLTRAGLLDSHRGASGGYALARPASQINMVQIIDAIDGPVALTECVSQPGSCSQEPVCSLGHNWRLINDALRKALSEVSLADLTAPTQSQVVNFEDMASPEKAAREYQ